VRRARDEGAGGDPLPEGEAKTARVQAMFDRIAPRYDLVNVVMTFGLDRRWRHRTVRALALAPGSVVLDLAAGTGDLSRGAARAGYRTVGVDLSAGMLEADRSRHPRAQGDSARLPFADGSFDGVVCGYALRNFTDLPGALSEAARVLRPGGRLSVLEIAEPPPGPWRTGYRIWFHRVVPVIGGVLSDKEAYRYLPRSTAYLPDEAGLRRMLQDAGFSTVGRRMLAGGLSQLLTATRRGLFSRGAAP
jgi:demethylmenaquinone methyltransferase/2-methoxy-6-polyprenyl-1,4-benzoquinol methylase